MTDAAPAPSRSDEATFYLDEPAPDDPPGHWPARRNARTWRFTLLAGGGVLTAGSATALCYGAGSAMWTLLLFAGVLMLMRGVSLWLYRPFLRFAEDGLVFRLEPRGSKHTVAWSDIAHLELELEAARLHRTDDPTMHLRFDTLRKDKAHRLRVHLGDTARRHGVSVYDS